MAAATAEIYGDIRKTPHPSIWSSAGQEGRPRSKDTAGVGLSEKIDVEPAAEGFSLT
jgi:hypothetical protein